MEDVIRKLKISHNFLMRIGLSAQDAIDFANGIVTLREAISDLTRLSKEKAAEKATDEEEAGEEENATD